MISARSSLHADCREAATGREKIAHTHTRAGLRHVHWARAPHPWGPVGAVIP